MLNKVQLIGHIGKDPERRYTASGTPVASFSLATNERFKDRNGQTQDVVDWHRVVLMGKVVEALGQYLTKGRLIHVEGKLKTRSYERDGQKMKITEVVAERVLLLGNAKGEAARPDRPTERPADGPVDPPSDEDIPF